MNSTPVEDALKFWAFLLKWGMGALKKSAGDF